MELGKLAKNPFKLTGELKKSCQMWAVECWLFTHSFLAYSYTTQGGSLIFFASCGIFAGFGRFVDRGPENFPAAFPYRQVLLQFWIAFNRRGFFDQIFFHVQKYAKIIANDKK